MGCSSQISSNGKTALFLPPGEGTSSCATIVCDLHKHFDYTIVNRAYNCAENGSKSKNNINVDFRIQITVIKFLYCVSEMNLYQ